MALLCSRYYDVARQFFSLNLSPIYPNISAVLIGGSRIYSAKYGQDECCDSDWDGAIIVGTKLEILQLVNEQRSSLMAMLGIVREEFPELLVPKQFSPHWDHFDAVRIAGFDRLGMKRSVKILSLDYFSMPKTSLRILSFKDKRIFEGFGPTSVKYYRVQQALWLYGELYILHDPWAYTSPANDCAHRQPTAFGVTADLLVSGFWLHGHEPHGRMIQRYILAKYSTLLGSRVNTQSFAKHPRFSSEYRSWLAEELSNLHPQSDSLPEQPQCPCPYKHRRFLCGPAVTALDMSLASPSRQNTSLSTQCVERYKRSGTLLSQQLPPSAFFSNSTATVVMVPAATHDETAIKVFCKRSQYPQQEIQGASNASAFGLRIQLPHATSSGDLLYPFFEGKTESELRLSICRTSWSNCQDIETLLYAELVKAEDMLRLYNRCLTDCNTPKVEPKAQPIHRFFYSRLINDVRFSHLYGDSLSIGGGSLSAAKLLEKRWKVNGVIYPSLGALFELAIGELHPSSVQNASCPIVFGLGDAHGGNVMIGDNVSLNNGRHILYVDYEVAGFHPIMLDLAKPLYNDVFFSTLYMDVLPELPNTTTYSINDDLIEVDFPQQVDDITQAGFDIKRRYLLQPLFELAARHGRDLQKNIPLLSNALFVCATLTRDYSKHPGAFVRNMAAGIILSQAVDLEGFYLGLQCLRVEV